MEKNSRISGKDLASLMRIDANSYRDANIHRFGHSFLHPCELLTGEEVFDFPERVQRVTDSRYKSGEIWLDIIYEVMYLYVGKTPEGNDVAIRFGRGFSLCWAS